MKKDLTEEKYRFIAEMKSGVASKISWGVLDELVPFPDLKPGRWYRFSADIRADGMVDNLCVVEIKNPAGAGLLGGNR